MSGTPSVATVEPQSAASDPTDDEIWAELSAADHGDDTGADHEDGAAGPEEDGQNAAEDIRGDGNQSPAGTDPAGTEDDIWAGANEAQRAAIQQMRQEMQAAQAERDRFKHENQSNRGRISAYQKQINELSGHKDGPSLDDRLKQVVDEYPEVAGPIAEELKDLRNKVHSITANTVDADTMEMETRVQKRHPDYSAFVKQNINHYVEFLDRAPQFMRDIATRNDDVIRDDREVTFLLDNFKGYLASQQPPTPTPQPGIPGKIASPSPQQGRRQRQIVSAVGAPTNQSRSPSVQAGEGPAPGSPEGDWDYWRRKDESRRGA